MTLFNKRMNVLTYTSYKKNCDLYIEIHGLIAINTYHIELAQKYIILVTEVSIMIYKTGKRTSVENHKFIHFNAKIKVVILQQSQDWEPPEIKELRLVIPEDYTFMASNHIFIADGIPDNYLEKTTLIRSTLPPGS